MKEDATDSLYEIYDTLSPYEVAILAFTSPRTIAAAYEFENTVVITTKETYLWAGAIAHALVKKPYLDIDEIITALNDVVNTYFEDWNGYRDLTMPSYGYMVRPYSRQPHVVLEFLRALGIKHSESVFERTEAAVRSLIWRGHIEDPFSKKVGAIATAVLLVMPVGFTSEGPHKLRIDALTWQYVQKTQNNVQSRELRVKVKEISDVFLNKIVPAAVGAVDKLSGASDGQGMRDRDIQIRLAELGYYSGTIDGKVGPKTIQAIRRFQSDNHLDITGYPDPVTLQRLKKA